MSESETPARPAQERTTLLFAGFDGPLALAGAERAGIDAELELLLPHWPRPTDRLARSVAPDIIVEPIDGGLWRIDYRTVKFRTEVPIDDLSYNVASKLTTALRDQVDGQCDLHAAGVEVDGGAVLFVGETHAGKSTMALEFASRGFRVIDDDHLILRPDEGGMRAVACGRAMRARMPFPAWVSERLRTYVKDRYHEWDDVSVMCHPQRSERVPFGQSCPVSRIFILNRTEVSEPHVSAVAATEALKLLLFQAGSLRISASALLEYMRRTIATIPVLKLNYERADDAVDLVRGLIEKDTSRHSKLGRAE